MGPPVHADVILIDKTMLLWNLAELPKDIPHLPAPSAIRFEPIPVGASLDWFVGFRSAALCEHFDRALQEIRQDGTYDRIVARYLPDGRP